MTAFFDDLRREVSDIKAADRADWLAKVAAIEAPVIETVRRVASDHEFPADLRQKIVATIASEAVVDTKGLPGRQEAKDYAWAVKMSGLLEALHSLFHQVASRRIRTRFGLLSDSPRAILKAMETHDSEEA